MTDNTLKAALITGAAAIASALIVGISNYLSGPRANAPTHEPNVNANTSTSKSSARTTNPEPPAYGSIFNMADPIPVGLDAVKIGTSISVLMSVFPNGVLSPPRYTVVLDRGPFKQIQFVFGTVKKETKVTAIFYDFRNSLTKESIHKQALLSFGEDKVVRRDGGKTLEWRDLNGYQLILNEYSYSVFNSGLLLR